MNMQRLFLILSAICIQTVISAQDTPGKTFGGFNNDIGYSICNSNDRGFLLAGTTRNNSTSSEDIYIIKVDKNGNEQWQKIHGWEHHDIIRSVLQLDDGYLLVGEIWDFSMGQTDIYLMKIDLYGNLVWDKLFGTNAREIGFKAHPSIDGGYLILGYTRGYDNAGDVFLIKTNEVGEEIWRNTYGLEFDDYGRDLIQNEDGSIFIFGSKGSFYNDVHYNFKNHDSDMFLIKVDANGNEIWQKSLGGTEHDLGYSMSKTEQDGFYLFGSTQSLGNGSFDMLLVRTNEQGNILWQKTYGGIDYDQGWSMARNDQNELFLFGTTKSFGLNNSPDLYLIKTDDLGNEIWSLTIGGDNTEIGHEVIATPDSGCIVIGQTNSFGNGMFDMIITKIDKNGIIEYFIDSIDKINTEDIVVYPIPVRNQGKIKFKNNSALQIYKLEIISITGIHSRVISIYPPDYSFNINTLPPGLYFYQIISEDNSTIRYKGKLVIQ